MADRTKDRDDLRDENPGMGEQAGEGVGGIGGTLGGAALGSMAGPVGTIVGGIAGALGGWWAGEKVGRAAEDAASNDDEYRRDYETTGKRDMEYNDVRVGYTVGHIAAHNPDYSNRSFDDVDRDLRRGWSHDKYQYDALRPYVQRGYERGRTRRSD